MAKRRRQKREKKVTKLSGGGKAAWQRRIAAKPMKKKKKTAYLTINKAISENSKRKSRKTAAINLQRIAYQRVAASGSA